MSQERQMNILLVEDTEEHALLIRRALEDGKLKHRLFVARDGTEALDYLYRRGDYANEAASPKPDIILLDLRLPDMRGTEVLEQIRSEEGLKDIPVVVLTVSDEEQDIIRSFRAGAGSYLLKSAGLVHKQEASGAILDAVISLVGK